MNPDAEFFIYSRQECHLCDHFLTDFLKFLGHEGYACHVINIDSDPELKQRYGARIPVLVASGVELCEGTFNKKAVCDYINKLNAPSHKP